MATEMTHQNKPRKKPAKMPRLASETKDDESLSAFPHTSSVIGKFIVDVADFTPGECVNCGAPVVGHQLLFCGERCRQIGELVRYARRKIAEGTYERPDIAEAIDIRKSQLIFGFYDKAARRVPDEVRQELLANAGGVCARCGGRFTVDGDARFTVQHSAAETGMKLESWCYRCNMDHARSVIVELDPTQRAFANWFDFRVHQSIPIAACDDPENWPKVYRSLMVKARAAPRRASLRTAP